MKNLILTAKTVLPISSPPIKNGAVAICGRKIKAVGSLQTIQRKHPDFSVHSLGGALLPGFVNCHAHLELGPFAPKKKFANFADWLEQIVVNKIAGANKTEIKRSVKNGVSELIKSGVTTIGEISSYGHDAELLKKSQIRTVLFHEITDGKPEFKIPAEKSDAFEERLSPHAVYSCSPELIKKILKISARNKIPVAIHLAESAEETAFVRGEKNAIEKNVYPLIGKVPMKRHRAKTAFGYFSEIDSAKAKITAVHMAHVRKDEIKKVRERNIGIVLCPRSGEFTGAGSAPVLEYAKLERVGLGTDGLSSNYNLNFLDEIKALYKLLLPLGKENAAEKAVYIATLGGAKALFLEEKIGSIEKGKEADLIFVKNAKTGSAYLNIIKANSAERVFFQKKS